MNTECRPYLVTVAQVGMFAAALMVGDESEQNH